MKNRDTITAYSAQDIAGVLLRPSGEIADLIAYERTCALYAHGEAGEDLSPQEQDALRLLEDSADSLSALGFRDDQIAMMIGLLHESFEDVDIRAIPPDMAHYTFEKRMMANMFGVVAFPYGPPIVLHQPHHALKAHGYSETSTRAIMTILTNRLACKLMEKRSEMPGLLSVAAAAPLPAPPYAPDAPDYS